MLTALSYIFTLCAGCGGLLKNGRKERPAWRLAFYIESDSCKLSQHDGPDSLVHTC